MFKPHNKDKRKSFSSRNKSNNDFPKRSSTPFHNNRDNQNNRKGQGFNRKQSYREKFKISIESVLDYFYNHNGIVLADKVKSEFSEKDSDMFFSKVNLLMKHDAIIVNNNELSLNIEKINPKFGKFACVKIKNLLLANHYLVEVIPLVVAEQKFEDELIIEDVNQSLIHKKLFVKLSSLGEKIMAKPIFYLDDINIKKVESAEVKNQVLIKGIYQKYDSHDNMGEHSSTDIIVAIDFKSRKTIHLLDVPKNLPIGAIVKANLLSNDFDNQKAVYVETLATERNDTSPSMMSVFQYNLTKEFPQDCINEAQQAVACSVEGRKDIRDLPLVTIDGEDAKDFDDAIFAEKLLDRDGAYKIYVAIADVSHYVNPNSPLDLEASNRGNSIYLPEFVIPMLPHELSNGWCSLNPNEDRGCLLCEMVVNRNGEVDSFEFSRALMKSKARLTYTAVQQALDGSPAEHILPIMDNIINPLYEAYRLLDMAKKRRHAIEIESSEKTIIFNDKNEVIDIKVKTQSTANKIVEEFMIAANVASAKFIAKNGLNNKQLAIYRVHDKPSLEKIDNLIKVLKSVNIFAHSPKDINGQFFNSILLKYKNDPITSFLNETILRSQAQAEYNPINIGHFGLALKEYCHFTSPIRRYSDLMVHRLILSIIDNQPFVYTMEDVDRISKHISITERVAFQAEMSAKERLISKWYASQIGNSFPAQISTITNAGLFVNLTNGVSGLLPIRLLSRSYAFVDLENNQIRDKHFKRTFKLGDKIQVILKEADTIRGLLTFMLDEQSKPRRR